jgi:glyoxylase-like metal-dependent hydrolase (beta-lactamase superfamily II)
MGNLSWSIGRVRITRVVEREVALPLAGLLPEATEASLEKHRAWLEPHFLLPGGLATLSIHGLVVESEGRRILVDTCIGGRRIRGYEALSEGGRPFLDDLAAAGFPAESIDFVLCTHLHFDHVGWNTRLEDGRWVPSFPNARYVFARPEWEHWSRETSRAFTATLDEAVRPVFDAGLADLVPTDHALTGEVRLEPSPGHTPGHVCVRIESEGARALVTGDMTHHPVQWAEPDWKMVADTDPDQAKETRRRIRGEHADRPTLVIGTHYAPPCAGHIVRTAEGWAFRAKA